jgi:hypothetical protein
MVLYHGTIGGDRCLSINTWRGGGGGVRGMMAAGISISLSVQSIFTDTKNSGLKKGLFFSFVPIPYVCTYVGCTGLSRGFSNQPKWREPPKLRETKLIGRQVGSNPG